MKRLLLSTLLLAAFAAAPASHGNVVRPAPDFTIAGGKTARSLRGQAVVILVAPSPDSKEFRRQVRRLEKDYNRFAAQNTVFVAAFTASNGQELRSSIPFAIALNGPELAARYGVQDAFALFVVGPDGNIDLRTSKVSGNYAIRDAILNNYERQAATRRVER